MHCLAPSSKHSELSYINKRFISAEEHIHRGATGPAHFHADIFSSLGTAEQQHHCCSTQKPLKGTPENMHERFSVPRFSTLHCSMGESL